MVGSWGGAALCMFLLPTAMDHSPTAGFAVFIVATMLVYGAFSISSSYIMQLLGGERGMGGAIQNSLGNLGGFVGPYLIGALKDATGSYFPAMYLMGAGLSLACIIVAVFNPHWSEKKAMPNMHLQEDYDKSKRAESGLPDDTDTVSSSSNDQNVQNVKA